MRSHIYIYVGWGGVFLNNLDIFLCGQARIVNAATSLEGEIWT